jgi:hypothetical protein
MFWFKTSNYTGLLLTLLLISAMYSCRPDVKPTAKYFDLEKYFTGEAARLSNHKPILKTVTYNNVAESKTVLIKNWQRELALFAGSDINKPAWKSSYSGIKNADSMVYRATDTNLRTREIIIKLKVNKVVSVLISNFTKNMLYQTRERLMYYPDSLYYIEKHQLVRLLGTNNYQITGKFIK